MNFIFFFWRNELYILKRRDNELGFKWIFSNFIAEFSILVSYLHKIIV